VDGAHAYENRSPRAEPSWAARLQTSGAVRDGLAGSNLRGMSGLRTVEAHENRGRATRREAARRL